MTQDLKINPAFEKLIPSLTEAEFKILEENVIKSGCRDPIVVWNGYIIDGHHRYKICKKHNLSFKTVEEKIDSEPQVKMWMIDNQFGRRDVPIFVKIELVLKFEDFEKEVAQERMKSGKADPMQHVAQGSVRDRLGKKIGVSGEQIRRVKKILEICPTEVIEDLRNGFRSISDVFKELQEKSTPEPVEDFYISQVKTTIDGKLYIKEGFNNLATRKFGHKKGSLNFLEESILEFGLMNPCLLVWGDIIIDGHARYRICCKHNIPYTTEQIEFNNDLEAAAYILKKIESDSCGRQTNKFSTVLGLFRIAELEKSRDQRNTKTEEESLTEEDIEKLYETAEDFEIDKKYTIKCLKIIKNGDDEMIRKCQTGDVVESVYEELSIQNSV